MTADGTAAAVLACAVVAAVTALLVLSRGRGTAGRALAVVLAAVALWDVAYAAELLAADPAARLRLGDLKYAGIGLLGPAYLAFVLAWTGRARLVTRRLLAVLAVEPAVLLVLLALPASHDLVRSLPAGAPDPLSAEVAVGPLFWAHLVYTDLLLLGATALLVTALLRRSRAYWLQAAAVCGAALLPWAANLLFTLSVGPFGEVDLTPPAFTLTAAVLAWGLFDRRLLRLVPLARSVVVEQMPDGVVVLDADGHVTDVNPAARAVLGGGLVGSPAAAVLPPEVLAADGRVLELRRAGEPRSYEVTGSDVAGGRDPAGRLLVLRDVTRSAVLERQLRELLAEQARVAEQLSSSLRPARLPAVAGLDLAARFRPAGEGSEIGGDFYDVVAVDGEWAFTLGDVSGKGARAAATTAHARYALRTLALSGAGPAAALEQLHHLVAADVDDETYLTAVHGRVRVGPDGAHVVLALGGHPQPLLLHADGHVEPVGVPGSAIGLLDDAEVHDSAFRLAPGDALVLFTDGVSEARDGAALFGERGLTAALTGLAGRAADDVARALLDAVLGLRDGSPGDDIAVLVLAAPVGVAPPAPRPSHDAPAPLTRQRS